MGATRKSPEELKKDYDTVIVPKLKLLAADLGNKVFFYDNCLTLADIFLYTILVILKKFAPA